MNSFTIAGLLVRRTIGSKRGLLLYIALPVVVISVIVGLFGHTSAQPVTVHVWNKDDGKLGREVVRFISETELFNIVEAADSSETALRDALETGKAGAAVTIPANFSALLASGGVPVIGLERRNERLWNVSLLLSLESVSERLVKTAKLADGLGLTESERTELMLQLLEKQRSLGAGFVKEQVTAAPGASNTLVIGLMLLFVMLTVNQSIHAVMEDRTNRTMARMYAAPVRAGEIAAGNLIGSLLIGTLQLVMILLVVYFIIGYSFGLPFGSMLLIMEFFLLAALGIASAVAGVVKNMKNLGYINNLVVTPTCMLGGCFWPIGMMPDFMQKLANFTPQRWAILAVELSAGGVPLHEIVLYLGILLLFAAVMFAFGAYVLQPNKEAVK